MSAQFSYIFVVVVLVFAAFLIRPASVQTMSGSAPAKVHVVKQEQGLIQIQVGNGMIRQLPVGEPSAKCEKGTMLDLTQAGVDLLGNGYYFAKTQHTLAPSIREINGKEQVYLVTVGQESEYVVFWLPTNGGIAAVQMSENVPAPMNISTTSYQGWKITSAGNRVTLVNGKTTIWITRTGNYFCVELQTTVSADDRGILKFFAENGVLPQGEEIEKFLPN